MIDRLLSNQTHRLSAVDSLASMMHCSRGQELDGPDGTLKSFYRVVSGVVRKCAVLADGRRRIVDFKLPGDFFGFTLPSSHHITREAVVDRTIVACYPRRRIEELAEADAEVGRWLREMACQVASHLEGRILLLGRNTAREKVGAFLLEMAERSSRGAAEDVVLPMSRYDIGDYLALSAETVSRALTELKQRAAIQLVGVHDVRIVDREALEEAT